jgi:hypothetical protein
MTKKLCAKDFSLREQLMLNEIIFEWPMIAQAYDSQVAFLDTMALHCFRKNATGLAVNSLRRCVNALHDCTHYRETPEYDALILL